MEKLSEVKKVEDISKDKTEEVEFTNGMLEAFMTNPDVGKFLEADFEPVLRNRVYRFSIKIFKSPAMEAYQKVRQEMIDARQVEIDEFDKEHVADAEALGDPTLVEGRPDQIKVTDDIMQNLLKEKSGLTIGKFRMKDSEVPKGWKTSDMLKVDWFVEFVEG